MSMGTQGATPVALSDLDALCPSESPFVMA